MASSPPASFLTINRSSSILSLSTEIWQEWGLLFFFWVLSFIPWMVYGSMTSILFIVFVLVISLLNIPVKEVVTFDKEQGKIVKEFRKGLFLPPWQRIFDLKEFSGFYIEESTKKPGAYRIIMEFTSGMNVSLTEAYYYSTKAVEHKTITNRIFGFLGREGASYIMDNDDQ